MAMVDENSTGRNLPVSIASRAKMLPDVPRAREVLEKCGQEDLGEMIFGEDVNYGAVAEEGQS